MKAVTCIAFMLMTFSCGSSFAGEKNCRELLVPAVDKAAASTEKKHTAARQAVIYYAAQSLRISFTRKQAAEFKAQLHAYKTYISDMLGMPNRTYDHEYMEQIFQKLDVIVRQIINNRANAEMFNAKPIDYASRERVSSQLYKYFLGLQYNLPFETLLALAVADYAYLNLSAKPEFYERFSLTDKAFVKFMFHSQDRAKLSGIKLTDLAKLSEKEIHKRRQVVMDEITKLRNQYLVNVTLPSELEALLDQLAEMASPDFKIYGNQELVQAVETKLHSQPNRELPDWYLSTLFYEGSAVMRFQTSKAEIRNILRGLIIENNKSKLMPKEVENRLFELGSESEKIGIVISRIKKQKEYL